METEYIAPLSNNYNGMNVDAIREKSRERLQHYLASNAIPAREGLQRVFQDVPEDALVRADSFRVAADPSLYVTAPKTYGSGIHPHALGQIAERAGVPLRYLRESVNSPEDWRRELGADIINRTMAHSEDRYLVRAVGGEIRGVLSDKFKRMDSRPSIECMITEAMKFGARISEVSALDTKLALKIVIPEMFEAFPGEFMLFGLEFRNSDYGDGAKEISAFLKRLICLNGMTREVAMRKIHIGGRLGEGIAYSDETQEANVRADALATGDTVRHLLAPVYRDTLVKGIRDANDRKVDAKARAEQLVKGGKLSKEEGKRAAEIFLTPDIEMLPPGQTVWRWSNTLSFMAGQSETDAYRRLDLERLAGDALT